MNYSIVIPVFNREDLTRQCLETLPATLEGAGEGEVIIVDNGSTSATAAVLADFPWVRLIRNDRNLGFAAACNQGAQAAHGRYVVHLNNDTVARPRWLANMLAVFDDEENVGVVGAKLFFPDGTLQHAGVVSFPARLTSEGFGPYHLLWKARGDNQGAMQRADFDIVTGACLAVPRDLFVRLGGFEEIYWNGYEDVDFCLKVRAEGLRVIYEPSVMLTHFESQSGVQRKRRVPHNIRELAARWSRRIAPDDNAHCDKIRAIRRERILGTLRTAIYVAIPPTTVIVHGPQPADPQALVASLRPSGMPVEKIFWCAEGDPPPGVFAVPWAEALATVAENRRADRYIALMDTRTQRTNRWLNELVNAAEFASDICAATALPREEWDHDSMPMTIDPRCALIALRNIPLHIRFDPSFETIGGSVVDWIDRTVACGASIRAVLRDGIELGPEISDATYEQRHGYSLRKARQPNAERLEQLEQPDPAFTPFATIVTLSWNAPEYTEMAIASIRAKTRVPYEIIIVDNGSSSANLSRVRALAGPDVRIIENKRNMGFAHGCNQGMAAASGTHVVLLNNDVVVTDGWLETLLEAHRRDPRVGISAPRSNRVAGHQQIGDGLYMNLEQMHELAAQRSRTFRNIVYSTDRVIGFCMCISREVLEEVGGIDTRYDIGNFEDDDYCIRVRSAGYRIVVCEDSFIHHFGSVSFNANKIDYSATMLANWRKFSDKFALPTDFPEKGYDSRPAISRGFIRDRDFVPLPKQSELASTPIADLPVRIYQLTLTAFIADERDWNQLASLVKNFLAAFDAEASVCLVIGVGGTLSSETIGQRILRAAERAGRNQDSAPDIEIIDAVSKDEVASLSTMGQSIAVETLIERSPSALERLLKYPSIP